MSANYYNRHNQGGSATSSGYMMKHKIPGNTGSDIFYPDHKPSTSH